MRKPIRNIILVIAIILVAGAILIPFSRRNAITFSVKHPDHITRIVITGDTSRLVLAKDHVGWMANRTDPVRKDAIAFLLHTLGKIEVRSTLSGNTLKKIKEDTAAVTTNITIFRGWLPVRRFMMITTGDSTLPPVFTKPGSARMVTIYLPGEEEIGFYPFTTHLHYWQSHEIFRFLPGQVQKVILTDYLHPENNFETGTSGSEDYFFHRSNGSAGTGIVDTMKVRRYLSYFQALSFDDFARNLTPSEKTRILQRPSRYTLEIISETGDTTWIRTIPKMRGLTSGSSTETPDPDLTWAYIRPLDELVIIRYFRIDPLLKAPTYFYRQE